MKILLLAAALSLSGAAYAQAGQPPDSGDVSTPDATAPATAPDSTAPDTTAPDSTAPAATTSAPTSTDTATAPEASTKNYPPCSRTVTDNCMQGGGRHHARRR